MKITVFTSNQARHLSLIRDLASIADEVYAVMEVTTVFAGQKEDFFKKSPVMQKYFSKVYEAEKAIFGTIGLLPSNVRTLSIKMGDLSDVPMDVLKPVLQSDLYIVFGASYIKGELVDYLIEKKAINIHMGISPYYRGSSCNFWACYDRNYHLVGATVHLLSKGLDSGDILFTTTAYIRDNPFSYTMSAVEEVQIELRRRIKAKAIPYIIPQKQDRSKQIRYTRNADFTDEVAQEFMERVERG